jgi:hypothetical protein
MINNSDNVITFEHYHKPSDAKIVFSMSGYSHITEVMEQFQRFLKAMGYEFPIDCSVGFVDEFQNQVELNV